MVELSIKVLSFDSFTDLGEHLQSLRQNYKEQLKEYEDKLGNILRDYEVKVSDPKEAAAQKEWIRQMKSSLGKSSKEGATASTVGSKSQPVKKDKEKEKAGKFGKGKNNSNDGKQSGNNTNEGWTKLGPSMIFLGKDNKGLGELYFDSINAIRNALEKISSILSICETLKTKTAGIGSGSLIVYFAEDVPQRIMVKMKDAQTPEKYRVAYSLTIPASASIAKSVILE